jgi:hypothetical protein
MPKEKIFDIRPPLAKKRKEKKKEKLFWGKSFLFGKKAPGNKKRELTKEKKKSVFFKGYWLLLPVGLFVALFLFLHFSSRAKIEIWSITRPFSFEKEVEAMTAIEESNFSSGMIRGKIVTEEESLSRTFSASGSAINELKAQGKVRVVNNYSLDQILVAKTRFLSGEGKLFYLKERMVVPAGKSVEALVEAAEAGPEYNIKATTFSLPGLLGSPRYTAIYGESANAMSGGFRGTVAQVVSRDLENGEKNVENELSLILKKKLEEKFGSEFSLPGDAVDYKVGEKSFSAEEGDKVDNFSVFLKMSATGFAFGKSDLETLAFHLAEKEISEEEIIKADSLKVEPSVKKIEWDGKELYLKLKVSAIAVRSVDPKELVKALAGKSLKESEILLSSYSAIEKAKIKIFPFWVKRIPQDPRRIELELFDNSL